jgi:Spy/CpxP family protein refolding chaperone
MGLALAAELNGYPGPLHVLELADQLGLSAEQRARVQQLYANMQGEAQRVGGQLIEHEAALDRLFKNRPITPESLTALTGQIGQSQRTLRGVHLKYHLTTAELLTPDQMQRYAQLRGYR